MIVVFLFSNTIILRKYTMVAIVTLIISPLLYIEMAREPLSGLPLNPATTEEISTLMDYMFSSNSLLPVLPKLMFYFPYRFFVTLLSIILPLPVGLFSPIFSTGGILGRVVGKCKY